MTEEKQEIKAVDWSAIQRNPDKALSFMILGFKNGIVDCNDYGFENEADNPCEFNSLDTAEAICKMIAESEAGKKEAESWGLRNLFRVATVIVDDQWVSECTV